MSKTKSYRIRQPYYREGSYFEPGSIVTIPADEKPSATWSEVKAGAAEEAEAPAPVAPPKPKGKGESPL